METTLLEMPTLPEGYFFRVTELLGAPMLELRLKSWPFSKRVESIWILEPNDEHLVDQAEFLKSRLLREDDLDAYAARRAGDYPPRTLNG